MTPLLGREQELAQLTTLLHQPEVRLLSLTGPGGVGKTRLAISAARALQDDFADGVCFFPLAAINDPDFVMPTIAQALGLRETGARSPLEQLQAALEEQSLLMLLDNFEQVLLAAPELSELLAACPRLRLLVTSRATLRVQGEHEFAVSPLPLPDLKYPLAHEALLQNAAITLFIQRAQAIKPGFQVTEANVRSIAEVCVRLDGLPLALELAAARTRLLSPQALLARLSRRLEVLTGGARTLPERQQTLRATIAWSYNLLASHEQRLFRYLSVFAGGCTLDAAEAIARAAGLASSMILDGVSALLENHLLRQQEQPDGESRLFMLETIREFGLECLESCGELETARITHAAYFLSFVEQAEPHLKGGQQLTWQSHLEREQENMRSALQGLIERDEAELALRFFAALAHYWIMRGYENEGRHWLGAVSTLLHAAPHTASQARALVAAAELASALGDNLSARSLTEESIALARMQGDKVCLAYALNQAALARYNLGDPGAGQRLLEESIALAREVQDRWLLASSSILLGTLLFYQSQAAEACVQYEQGVTLFRTLADKHTLSKALDWLAYCRAWMGEVEKAKTLWQEALTVAREVGNQPRITSILRQLGYVALAQGDLVQADRFLKESLVLSQEIGDKRNILALLGYLALLFQLRGDLAQAIALAEEDLSISRETGHTWDIMEALLLLGRIEQAQGNLERASVLFQEGLSLAQQTGYKEITGRYLFGLGSLAVAEQQPRRAAHLLGAAEGLLDTSNIMDFDPTTRLSYERDTAFLRAHFGEQAYAALQAEGRAMPLQDLLTWHEGTASPAASHPPASAQQPSSSTPAGLTRRELEVLRLLAEGLSNNQIAERLVISPRTVDNHLVSIYSKLHVSSRTAAARYAHEQHLL
ncbi:MAG TPA: tetratricopeptide repeat protein [Ktedonobacteraceae bacterium]|nr:tetratricopeptide repeat protein [Ktedonobacteraceae bacterium]